MSTRAPHRRPIAIGLVVLGGMVGVGAREGLTLAFPVSEATGIHWITAAINIGGAFLLGVLLEVLARLGSDTGRHQLFRLFAGTGILGGFTTYSALATDTASLTEDGLVLSAALYALTSLLLGALAAGAGTAIGARWRLRGRITSEVKQ